MKTKFIFLLLYFMSFFAQSQTITFQNPSFEGTPAPHVTPSGWDICMPGYTPDTQPGSWGITLAPSNGSSYIAFVHQATAGWQEGAGQAIPVPLVAGVTYGFYIDLATTSILGSGIDPGCVELQVWGGMAGLNSGCDKSELLWSSGDIYDAAHIDQWVTHQVVFTPTQSWDHILFLINSLGCTDGPYVMLDNLVPFSPVPGTIVVTQNVSCNIMCEGEATINNYGLIPPIQYLWSNGDTTQTATGLCLGEISVQVVDSSGTIYYDTTQVTIDTIPISSIPQQEVCLVTVDTTTGKNMIIWEKQISFAIDSFYVQRETPITNNFQTIGKKAYTDLSQFIDVNSNPAQQSYRYILKALDSCGRLTVSGTPHKTCHLTVSSGMGGAWNLNWIPYNGFSYSSFLIYRGSSPSTMSLLTSVATSSVSYSDLTPPAGILYYAIVVQKASPCNPTDKILSSYLSSFSNAESTAGIGIQDDLSIPAFSVKPNPANDYFSVELNQQKYLGADFRLLDITGRLVYSTKINETSTKVSLQGINSGVYIGQIAKEGLPASSVRIVVSGNK